MLRGAPESLRFPLALSTTPFAMPAAVSFACAASLSLAACSVGFAQNPILPDFHADPSARVEPLSYETDGSIRPLKMTPAAKR